MRHVLLAVVLCCAVVSSGCEGLTMSERQNLDELQYYGIPVEQEYSRGIATWGNLFLGFGNFHLDQNGYGIVNLLFWPLSILWAPIQAYVDTPVLNQKRTIEYYYMTRVGQEKLATLRSQEETEKQARGMATPVVAPAVPQADP